MSYPSSLSQLKFLNKLPTHAILISTPYIHTPQPPATGFHLHKANEVSSHEDHHDLGYPKSNEDFALLVLLFGGLNVLIHLIYLVSEIVKIFKYSIEIEYSHI